MFALVKKARTTVRSPSRTSTVSVQRAYSGFSKPLVRSIFDGLDLGQPSGSVGAQIQERLQRNVEAVSDELRVAIRGLSVRNPYRVDASLLSHDYIFASPRMRNSKQSLDLQLVTNIEDSFDNVLNQPGKRVGNTVLFSTGDKIVALDPLKGSGSYFRLAYTSEKPGEHGLEGVLVHAGLDVDGLPWNARFGIGRFRIRPVGPIVDFLNTRLGRQLWTMTDLARDLVSFEINVGQVDAKKLFIAFHGEDAYNTARYIVHSDKSTLAGIKAMVLYGSMIGGGAASRGFQSVVANLFGDPIQAKQTPSGSAARVGASIGAGKKVVPPVTGTKTSASRGLQGEAQKSGEAFPAHQTATNRSPESELTAHHASSAPTALHNMEVSEISRELEASRQRPEQLATKRHTNTSSNIRNKE